MLVLEKKIFKVFTLYGRGGHLGHGSCDPDTANELSFPLPKEAPYKIWLWLAKRFPRCLKLWTDGWTTDGRTDDGRTPDNGYTIGSPLSLRLR